MYTGNDGIYTHTFEHEARPDCPVCGQARIKMTVNPMWTLEDWIDRLVAHPETQLKKPSLRSGQKSLYMQAPKVLERATRPNLQRTLGELLQSGDAVVVTDANLPISLEITITFE